MDRRTMLSYQKSLVPDYRLTPSPSEDSETLADLPTNYAGSEDSESIRYQSGQVWDLLDSVLHDVLYEDEIVAIVQIKDAHDVKGHGMMFHLGYDSTLKNAFEAFIAASCKQCRPMNCMRFKTADGKRLMGNETPQALNIKHNHTLSVRVYSNGPGLHCPSCRKSGYPKTAAGRHLDGDRPVLNVAPSTSKNLIRLHFVDPNHKVTSLPVKTTYRMKHAMGDYARLAECDVRTLRFFFDGERISEEDTPEEMGMKDRSTVEVFMDQMGA